MSDLYALTLRQPWAWAVARLGKDVENRTWRPPAWLIGQRLAIHAGQGWDSETPRAMLDLGIVTPDAAAQMVMAHMLGNVVTGIVAVATLAGWMERAGERTTVCGEVAPGMVLNSPWWTGPYGWLLRDIRALTSPAPCRGRQRLWRVPTDVAAVVEERLEVPHA